MTLNDQNVFLNRIIICDKFSGIYFPKEESFRHDIQFRSIKENNSHTGFIVDCDFIQHTFDDFIVNWLGFYKLFERIRTISLQYVSFCELMTPIPLIFLTMVSQVIPCGLNGRQQFFFRYDWRITQKPAFAYKQSNVSANNLCREHRTDYRRQFFHGTVCL